MIKALRIQMLGIRLAFARRMAYRTDFFVSAAINMVGNMVIPWITYLIYHSGVALPGWSLYEVLLIQGVFMIAKGIAFSLFLGVLWDTTLSVREGTFDIVLLKPHPALNIIMANTFNCDYLGIFFGGIIISGFALSRLPPIMPAGYAGFFLLFIFSILVLLSFVLVMTAVVFKWVGNTRMNEIFSAMTLFGQYPSTIFPKTLANFLTWIIPISMIAFVPTSALLGKPADYILPSMLASVVFFLLSLMFWNRMIRKYTSAGG